MKKKSKKTNDKNAGASANEGLSLASIAEDRNTLLSAVWGRRMVARLNKLLDDKFCGVMTVREFVAIVLADTVNFPRGIDTWLSIGDFEGNFCTNELSVTLGGSMSDHVCLCGDPNGRRC